MPPIPCLYLKTIDPSPYLCLFFHGNGEDIYSCYELLNKIRKSLNFSILAVEYPGYSIYSGEPSEK